MLGFAGTLATVDVDSLVEYTGRENTEEKTEETYVRGTLSTELSVPGEVDLV